jgi:hypothetical protein
MSAEVEEQEPRTDIIASFVVRGFPGSPAAITDHVGLRPTTTWQIGDRVGPTIQLRRDAGWVIDSGLPKNASFPDHAQAIIDKVITHSDKINTLCDVSKFLLFVMYIRDGDRPLMYLPPSIVKAVSELEAEIEFDLYIL